MNITEQLSNYQGITLSQMQRVSLMRRIDTKFVCAASLLPTLLNEASKAYFAQEIDGRRSARYYTLYYDTPRLDMYLAHLHDHANRQKLRVRSYVDSDLSFLEIKTKNNHGETRKKRVQEHAFTPLTPDYGLRFGNGRDEAADTFIEQVLRYEAKDLKPTLENNFRRITLVDYAMTERVTIDFNLCFHNLINDERLSMPNIVIIETKRSATSQSKLTPVLRHLGIRQASFSKYAIGMALTDPGLSRNRFKQRIRLINKISTTC